MFALGLSKFSHPKSFSLVITGPMGSGKTTELFRQLERVEIGGGKTLLFKPFRDNRDEGVKTHAGYERPALAIKEAREILDHLNGGPDAIGIEEAQFFDEAIGEVVRELVRKGVRVFVAGLDLDFMGRPFGPMPLLLTQAEYVMKLQAVCMECGMDASRVLRRVKNDEQVLVGGMDIYEPVCTHCHERWLREQE